MMVWDVLAEIIDSRVVPTVRLAEMFRQAASSRIIVTPSGSIKAKCHSKQKVLIYRTSISCPAETPEEIYAKIVQVIAERILKRFGLRPVKDVHIPHCQKSLWPQLPALLCSVLSEAVSTGALHDERERDAALFLPCY